MTIALLLLAAIVLTATMVALTLGVNELERKSGELSGLMRKRYVVRIVPKTKTPGPAGAPSPGPAGSPGAAARAA